MKKEKDQLTASMEDYLEAIAEIQRQEGKISVSDISAQLDVTKPSVNSALTKLSEKGYVVHERYGKVSLTKKGSDVSKSVQKRHSAIFGFLRSVLNIDEKTAQKDACGMEHAVSALTLERLIKFMKFAELCPKHENSEWRKGLRRYFETGNRSSCQYCEEDEISGRKMR